MVVAHCIPQTRDRQKESEESQRERNGQTEAFAQLRADFKEAKAACFCSSRFGAKIAAISEVSSEVS